MVDGEILPIWNYSIVSISTDEVTLVVERPRIGCFVAAGGGFDHRHERLSQA